MNFYSVKRSVLFVVFFALANFAGAQNLTVREIMREPSITGMRVESERLSPDGKSVVFLWNAEGKMPRDLYLASTSGGEPRKILSPQDLLSQTTKTEKEDKLNYGLIIKDEFVKARENQIGSLVWSPDSSRLLLSQGGDLFLLNIQESNAKPHRLTKTQNPEVGAQWLDDQRILYSQSGNLFVVNIEDFSLVQISREANPQAFISIFNATASENGEMVAYAVSDGSKQRALFVPNYLDQFTIAPTFRRGWTEQKVQVAKSDGSLENSVEIKLPKHEGVSYIRGLRWLADNRTLLIDRIDKDTKRRQIFLIKSPENFKEENVFLVTEETDNKWVAPLSRIIEPNPKNANQFFFASEKDGFNHLYLVNLDESKFAKGSANAEIRQLTNGNWQIEWAKWSGENENIIYSSTEKTAAEREIFVLNPKNDSRNILSETAVNKGMKGDFQISTKSNLPVLLYSVSQWNQPAELFAFICGECSGTEAKNSPLRLTKTTPENFLQRKWNEPKFISIKSKDNKQIPAKIYLPNNFDKKKKYPMAIFVHGAGYLQNIINGWNNYYREFLFNQLLTQKGYVVLDIDYRGSAGYGRDWRTDVHDFLGGLDYQDHIDAIDFMVENYAVNPNKVGVYGGSYGGFMAEMLAMRAPEKVAAAAALRPVADWKNYFASSPIYTTERLGFPDKNPEAYRRSSPIAHADKLERPLLILHGLVDDNVHAQDSIQLVEKLIRLGKTPYFEAMLYPSENHAFQRPESWTDEYERILAFFEKHLK
ncbi:MAG TPA: alpha/beta fold hydrolase [Pyrinomonadaceae bacterium]|nr:alpha/beta fold hydrolase [Pyrinomonadaceae bacterium]